jgi:RNA polymerase sigma factor (TIGR02999 family)
MSHSVTDLLVRVRAGERQASTELLPLVYEELRRLARARLAREAPGQTLQPTGLVHEAYLRLVGADDPTWENRGHFFAAAAEAMRRILIERARRYAAERHGGGQVRVTLQDDLASTAHQAEELLALDQALSRLEGHDPQMAQVVKLRYFAGLEIDETARALQTSTRSVNRMWTAARAWLARELEAEAASG